MDVVFDARVDASVRSTKSECEEASLRLALGAAAPFYRDSPQAGAQRKRGLPLLLALLDEAAPGISTRRRAFAAELFIASMTALGKHVSEQGRSSSEVDAWAAATADMFLAYLGQQVRG